MRVSSQLGLFDASRLPRKRGGSRLGAGRKPGLRPAVPHRARPEHRARHPVHVTLRARAGLPSFREQAVVAELVASISDASRSPAVGTSFRVVHFSVQTNHVHLIVEAHDTSALSRGMLGLNVRLARAINRVLRSRGSVWRERYHGRALRTPREVRNALVYVLMNAKKHGASFAGIDAFSSAPWFEGFVGGARSSSPRPTAAARTWLAGVGWRRHGLIRLVESPRSEEELRRG